MPCGGEQCLKHKQCDTGEICCANKCYRKVCVTGTAGSEEEDEESEEAEEPEETADAAPESVEEGTCVFFITSNSYIFNILQKVVVLLPIKYRAQMENDVEKTRTATRAKFVVLINATTNVAYPVPRMKMRMKKSSHLP